MFSILNRALSWAITSFGNKFCLKMRSRLIKALDNRFYVKFMQFEIGLLAPHAEVVVVAAIVVVAAVAIVPWLAPKFRWWCLCRH